MATLEAYTICLIINIFCMSKIVAGQWRNQTKLKVGMHEIHQKVLLISLDGLRWDFISKQKHILPNITSLQKEGVTVSHVQNVFPTNTFPNHYSTVTGLYPESHGIIDNQMYDVKTGGRFSMETTDAKWWNEAEPIWITNQIQGHKSGVSNWPGYNVKIRGKLPSFTDGGNTLANKNQESIIPSNEKVDIALHWLQQHGVTFVALYFEEPDTLMHGIGDQPLHQQIEATVRVLDSVFGHLKHQLEVLGLKKQVNVIVIGDHGYEEVSNRRIIKLNDFINTKKYIKETTGMTLVSVFPKHRQLLKIYKKLKKAHPKMKAYLKSNLPKYMHIKKNKRTAPLLLLADSGWLIDTGTEDHVNFQLDYFRRGEHGYSSLVKDMHPGFFAFGPCFKKGETFNRIRTVDVYPLMCAILDLKPRANNGSLDNMTKLLSKSFLTTLIG